MGRGGTSAIMIVGITNEMNLNAVAVATSNVKVMRRNVKNVPASAANPAIQYVSLQAGWSHGVYSN